MYDISSRNEEKVRLLSENTGRKGELDMQREYEFNGPKN